MPATRSTSQYRNLYNGQYSRECGAVFHTENNSKLIHLRIGKKLKKSVIESLIQKNIITKSTTFICSNCVSRFENSSFNQPVTLNSDIPLSNDEHAAESSTSDILSKDEQKPTISSSHNLDEVENLDVQIRSDVSTLYKDANKCNISKLLLYKPGEWLKDRPDYLVQLVKDLCGFSGEAEANQFGFEIAKIVELIYGCRNSKLVLPLSFQENILTYSCSHSKQLLSYNGRTAPAGSYDFLSKWMAEQSENVIRFPNGIVRSVFDNEQVIGKTYKVSAENKVPSSIVTSHIYISIDPVSELQDQPQFAPNCWLFDEPNETQKHDYLNEKADNINLFRSTRDTFLNERLKVVESENVHEKDFIDNIIHEKLEVRQEKICVSCGAENEATSRKCTNCKGNLIKETVDFGHYISERKKVNPYSSFQFETRKNSLTVMTGEPDLLNPNSFNNISQILFNLGSRAGIKQYGGNSREWLFLECDGGIYQIVENLIFNVYHCTKCKESFYGLESFQEHRCYILDELPELHEFGWLIPTPGLLHVEMNGCKAFFELNWEVMMQEVCKRLGFNTLKSLDYAKRCGDHHKSWRILEILYIAATDELLLPYVRMCKHSGISPTVDGYWTWCEDVVDPNYLYIQQMVLTFLHSLMVFRSGCRKGNAEAISAAKDKLSLLFYGRTHPRYQRIIAIDKFIEVMMPDIVKDIHLSSLTLSRTQNTGHYQGGDACLEEINKAAKAWINHGVPSNSNWIKVFRNLDKLNEVCKIFMR